MIQGSRGWEGTTTTQEQSSKQEVLEIDPSRLMKVSWAKEVGEKNAKVREQASNV